jgi:hypothetical protein
MVTNVYPERKNHIAIKNNTQIKGILNNLKKYKSNYLELYILYINFING